jgi:hypothetical protein
MGKLFHHHAGMQAGIVCFNLYKWSIYARSAIQQISLESPPHSHMGEFHNSYPMRRHRGSGSQLCIA